MRDSSSDRAQKVGLACKNVGQNRGRGRKFQAKNLQILDPGFARAPARQKSQKLKF